MLRKYAVLIVILISFNQLSAQQYGLYHTGTLFDGFENPAQKTFLLDYSRKFSSNLFLPNFGITSSAKGNDDFMRMLINGHVYNAKNVPLNGNKYNTILENSNVYLATLKIFHSYKYQKEIGLSWQVKTEGRVDYTNETLALLDSYRRFEESGLTNFDDAFNNKGLVQSYHQFSLSYRENYNKKLAFGVKLSLLSGITYNRLNITESNFTQQGDEGDITVKLKGLYKSSFLKGSELKKKDLVPLFKNPGAAITLGTNYTAKNGTFIMANLKDLGVIRWSKRSAVADFNRTIMINNPDTLTSKQVENKITDVVVLNTKRQNFYALTNAKLDFLISKPYGFYVPSLIASKNIFYKGGDVAFVNKFNHNDFSVSAIPSYNIDGLLLFGMQGMYKTPNFEVYLGSDNMFKTISQVKGTINEDETIGSGYNGMSFYMGVGFKFGRTMEHPQNSSTMPGLDNQESSFFKRLFGKRSRK